MPSFLNKLLFPLWFCLLAWPAMASSSPKELLKSYNTFAAPDSSHLKALQLVITQLQNKAHWKKESHFGEDCALSNPQSLGCALKNAQLSLTGEYQHRNLLMRVVRKKIGKHFFCRQGIHPIDGFNKHPKTTHQEVLFILEEVEQELVGRLGGRAIKS